MKHGNDDDCVDETVARSSKKPTYKSNKRYIHRYLALIILTSITILNAAHGKVIGLSLDGRKVGELSLLGVNLLHGVE